MRLPGHAPVQQAEHGGYDQQIEREMRTTSATTRFSNSIRQ